MTIIVDSREKEHVIGGILAEFDRQKIIYTVSKLPVADYMSLDNARLLIDRKHNLQELATNLCTNDRTRFWNEIREAKRLGVKLIVLCEHGGPYHAMQDVAEWPGYDVRNKAGQAFHISGRDLMERMYKVHISYGVEFLFCDKKETGRRIIQLLGGGENDR